jgi:hypothetical protein
VNALEKRLTAFAKDKQMLSKGPLCVALVLTRRAKSDGLPLNADDLLTEAQGQVAGLGKGAVQAILKDHGIDRVLAEEGGRTSRGSVGNMRAYVAFLNELAAEKLADLDFIEKWWIDRVRAYFSGKPFILRLDASKSLRSIIRDLLDQAEKRQREASGTMYVGTMMQHLVGAKLDLVLGGITHHGASVADEGSGREADFLMGDVAIHVTTTPGEALIRKCKVNLASSLRPVIVTTGRGTVVAQGLAEQEGIAERVDVLDAEQFIASNLYEHGRFELSGRRDSIERLISKYNEIVEECETDPSLQINLGK